MQAVQKRTGGQGRRLVEPPGAQVRAELQHVARRVGLDLLLDLAHGARQGTQADEVLRQGVHGVRGVRPEEVGQVTAGLGTFEAEVREQQQRLFPAVGHAGYRQPPKRE